MKKWLITIGFLCSLTASNSAMAYIGAGLGIVDEEEFGYALIFGVGLPLDFSLDTQLVGFSNSNAAADRYWLQGNLDLTYDLHRMLDTGFGLHPYVKGGFSYAGLVFDTAGFDSEASHGPGFNVGAGFDIKVLPLVAVGLDITHATLFLDGAQINGIQLAGDRTAHVLNILATVKFFAY